MPKRYGAILAPRAMSYYDGLDFELKRALTEHLERLCADPANLPTRAGFPYLPDGQLYVPELFDDGISLIEVVINFRYMPNEKDLWIAWIKVKRVT